MSDNLTAYEQIEKEAMEYFQNLHTYVQDGEYLQLLKQQLQTWKKDHFSFISRGKFSQSNYRLFVKGLADKGQLERYLNRSISYLYLRDIGKDLSSETTKKQINNAVQSMRKQLTENIEGNQELFSMYTFYSWAKKEQVETTFIWLMSKLNKVFTQLPEEMDVEHAKRKLMKLVAGVVMHQLVDMDKNILPEVRSKKIADAIRLGYCYGLTYPFIDDLLDAQVLSEKEEKQYTELLRTTFLTGTVPPLAEWDGENKQLMEFVHEELGKAFHYITTKQSDKVKNKFLQLAYIFFHSQEIDREKKLDCTQYSNEDLYIPIIVKSASSRLIARALLDVEEDKGFWDRTFYYGIYNQLSDDLADLFADLESGAVTPYTYYWTYHKSRSDLINPFKMYWTVIFYLIHHVYDEDLQVKEVIFSRAINGLKRLKQKLGDKKYDEVMNLFAKDLGSFHRTLEKLVKKSVGVEFFDKLLREEFIKQLRKDREEDNKFFKRIENTRQKIDRILPLEHQKIKGIDEPILDAIQYSLKGDGKRLRPILAWNIGVREYGLKEENLYPLIRSLEYMHTASLIFDDLPSQDNAPIRRGRPTIHEVYNNAIAELTGLFLTQQAVLEQASLKGFDTNSILHLIRYASQTTMDMCRGQAMDLNWRGKKLTEEQLKTLHYYKTGLGFEASLVMPAILANASEHEIENLKRFAYHVGIVYQIKDDILDFEGGVQLGKPVGQDVENNNSTFVTILGLEEAEKQMWNEYYAAIQALNKLSINTNFLQKLTYYFLNREK